MEFKPKQITIIGILLIVFGIIGAMFSYYVIIENPGEVYVEKLIFESDDSDYSYSNTSSKVIHLDKGEYDIWYEPDFDFLGIVGSPHEIEIEDPVGNLIFSEDTIFGRKEAQVSRDGRDYNRFGTFKITDEGDHTITVNPARTIYITPHIDVELGEALGMIFIILIVIGIVMIIIGIFLLLSNRSKEMDRIRMRRRSQAQTQYPHYQDTQDTQDIQNTQYTGYNYPPPPGGPPPTPPIPPPR